MGMIAPSDHRTVHLAVVHIRNPSFDLHTWLVAAASYQRTVHLALAGETCLLLLGHSASAQGKCQHTGCSALVEVACLQTGQFARNSVAPLPSDHFVLLASPGQLIGYSALVELPRVAEEGLHSDH